MWPSFIWESRTTTRNRCVSSPASKGAERKTFLYFKAAGVRAGAPPRWGALVFAAATVTIIPLLVQAAAGWVRRPDRAWLLHVPACWITLITYGLAMLRHAIVSARPHSRAGWGQ